MPITDHTRKVLWGLAGNECARCQVALVHAPGAAGDPHAIVGRECHIVARALNGPRGRTGDRSGLDAYDNLILLCANCHAVVDAQPELFPPYALRTMKAEHERRIDARKKRVIPEFKVTGRDRPVCLELIESGDALLAMCAHACSWAYEKPERLSSAQRELVGNFLQSCSDWGEIYEDIGPKGHLDAGGSLQDELDDLRREGLVVYAARRRLTLVAADSESPWPEVVIKVVHEDEAPRETAAGAAARTGSAA
jgi:hypothetical protein